MSDTQNDNMEKADSKAKRVNRRISTVSSHMVNYPVGLQIERPERTRQSLLSACPACRARSAA